MRASYLRYSEKAGLIRKGVAILYYFTKVKFTEFQIQSKLDLDNVLYDFVLYPPCLASCGWCTVSVSKGGALPQNYEYMKFVLVFGVEYLYCIMPQGSA